MAGYLPTPDLGNSSYQSTNNRPQSQDSELNYSTADTLWPNNVPQDEAVQARRLFSPDSLFVTHYTLTDLVRGNLFGKKIETQTEINQIPAIKSIISSLHWLTSEIEKLQRELTLVKKSAQANYEKVVERSAELLYQKACERIEELEREYESKIKVIRRSFKIQLEDAMKIDDPFKGKYSMNRNPHDVLQIMQQEQEMAECSNKIRFLEHKLTKLNDVIIDLRKKTATYENLLEYQRRQGNTESMNKAIKDWENPKPVETVETTNNESVDNTVPTISSSNSALALKPPSKNLPTSTPKEQKTSKVVRKAHPNVAGHQKQLKKVRLSTKFDVLSNSKQSSLKPDSSSGNKSVDSSENEDGNEALNNKANILTPEIIEAKKEIKALKEKVLLLEGQIISTSVKAEAMAKGCTKLNATLGKQLTDMADLQTEFQEFQDAVTREKVVFQIHLEKVKSEAEKKKNKEIIRIKRELTKAEEIRNQTTQSAVQIELSKRLQDRDVLLKKVQAMKDEVTKDQAKYCNNASTLVKEIQKLRKKYLLEEKKWAIKFGVLQRNYHALQEEYHLRNNLRKQADALYNKRGGDLLAGYDDDDDDDVSFIPFKPMSKDQHEPSEVSVLEIPSCVDINSDDDYGDY